MENDAEIQRLHLGFDALLQQIRRGVFISHITEEKPVALVLQKYLRLAFGSDFRVFVSTDAKSIGGGKKWFDHIIQNLRFSKVILVVVSQESKRREWTNFEAGFGDGLGVPVIPVTIKNFPLGQLAFPLAGFQGRSIDDIGSIIDDVAGTVGVTPALVDQKAYQDEITEAEVALIYKSLTVEPVLEGDWLRFDIQNVGNVDLELLMLETYIPEIVLPPHHSLGMMGTVVVASISRNNHPYIWVACCSQRGVYGNLRPVLRPIITRSMGKIRPPVEIPIRSGLSPGEKELSIFFQIHAIGYSTEEEERKIKDMTW